MGPREGPNIGTQDSLGSVHQTRANDRNWYYQRSIDLPRRFYLQHKLYRIQMDLSFYRRDPTNGLLMDKRSVG